MYNNPEDSDQNVVNEDNFVTDGLRNPVVLHKILEHFSSPELRQLSFVNKLWKCEARSVMRKRGQLTAYVKSHDLDTFHPREEVGAFISDLKQMNPVPFSGMNMILYFEFQYGPFPMPDPDSLQGVVLGQPSLLKSFSVELLGSWLDNLASPALQLTKKLLKDCSGSLEELITLFLDDGRGRAVFVEQIVKNCSFPRLKILKLRENYYSSDEEGYTNYIKAMLSRAPNLHMLHTSCPINLMLSMLEGSSVVPVYTSRVDAPFDEIPENVISRIKLESLKLAYTGRGFNFEKFNKMAPKLLQQSCTRTVHSVWLDACLAVPLMSLEISLKSVKYLNLDINYNRLQPFEQILEIVKSFDFTRIFPNLTKVEIVTSQQPNTISGIHYLGFIEQANAVLREPMPDRAINIKTVHLEQKNLSSPAAQFFADMFPSIDKLELKIVGDEPVPFETIWKNWLDLKEITVRGNMLRTAGNLDSVFCGIFPEEVAELREKDEDYLKRVNIVPVRPALTCLKHLRTLALNHEDFRYAAFNDDATFLFSKVTALLTFARMPDLAVSLHISARTVPPAMTQLEPYVSLTSNLLEDEEWFELDWPEPEFD